MPEKNKGGRPTCLSMRRSKNLMKREALILGQMIVLGKRQYVEKFFDDRNRITYNVIESLAERGMKINLKSIRDELSSIKRLKYIGNIEYLRHLELVGKFGKGSGRRPKDYPRSKHCRKLKQEMA